MDKKLSDYTELVPFNGKTTLVKDETSDIIAVKKVIGQDSINTYKKLQYQRHSNIANTIEVFVFEDNAVIIEEYISGKPLTTVLAEHTFTEIEVKNYATQLCDAVAFLHQNNIIHRDINPNNIIITFDGILKLIDFDIAREVKQNAAQDTTVLGTPGYAAPEQFGFTQTDARSDIYAIGVVISQMLSGGLPTDFNLAKKLREVVKKSTALDPKNRYNSATELKNALCGKRMIFDKRKWWIIAVPAVLFVQAMLLTIFTPLFNELAHVTNNLPTPVQTEPPVQVEQEDEQLDTPETEDEEDTTIPFDQLPDIVMSEQEALKGKTENSEPLGIYDVQFVQRASGRYLVGKIKKNSLTPEQSCITATLEAFDRKGVSSQKLSIYADLKKAVKYGEIMEFDLSVSDNMELFELRTLTESDAQSLRDKKIREYMNTAKKHLKEKGSFSTSIARYSLEDILAIDPTHAEAKELLDSIAGK